MDAKWVWSSIRSGLENQSTKSPASLIKSCEMNTARRRTVLVSASLTVKHQHKGTRFALIEDHFLQLQWHHGFGSPVFLYCFEQLDQYRCDDEEKANVKSKAKVFVFVVNQKREDDAIYRLKRSGEVHGKRTHFFQRFKVQAIGKHGAYPTQNEQPQPVGTRRQQRWGRKQEIVKRHEGAEKHKCSCQLVQRHGSRFITFHHTFVKDRHQHHQQSRQQTDINAGRKTKVRHINERNACQCHQPEQHFKQTHAPPEENGFEQGGEQAGGGHTRERYRYVGVLDAAVKT